MTGSVLPDRRQTWYVSVADFPVGLGATARARSICRALLLAGFDVRLLIPHALGHGTNPAAGGISDGLAFEYLNGSPVRPGGAAAVAWAKLRANVVMMRRVFRARRRLAAVFVYNATLFDCWGILSAALVTHVPVILDWSDEWYDHAVPLHEVGVARYLFKRAAAATESLLYTAVSRIIVVSRHLEERVARYKRKVVRCPVAFDASDFETATPERLGPPESFSVVYAGSLSSIEGVDILLDALNRLPCPLRQRLRLFVVGNPAHGQSMASYQQAAGTLLSEGTVTFLPAVDRARYASLLRGADLLVIPRPTSVASAAGFPYKLVEYISSGTPVLVTRFGDVGEYFEADVHCLMCDPDSPEALAAAIGHVMADPGDLPAMARRGQARVRELFSTEAVATQLGQLVHGAAEFSR